MTCIGRLSFLTLALCTIAMFEGGRRSFARNVGYAPSSPHEIGAACGIQAVDWEGQSLPPDESGTLDPAAGLRSASINENGQIAFAARVVGSDRNQGIFVSDAQGLRVIALGCGADGGSGGPFGTCGDPSPLGGTFAGFFLSTFVTPAINGLGDVLFIADVEGGSSSRGLFLYRASSDHVETVTAVGQPSPRGGAITGFGTGSINDAGTVVFLAYTDDASATDLLIWQDGTLEKYVGVGDAAPGGGTFASMNTESWYPLDGTHIPIGPVPAINDRSQIAFFGAVSGGETPNGLLLSRVGRHEWVAKYGDPAPGGSYFAHLWAPNLNNRGEVMFLSDLGLGGVDGTNFYAGPVGALRYVVGFEDIIDGGWVHTVSVTRNPMRGIADNGDVSLVVGVVMPDNNEYDTAIVVHPDATYSVLAKEGEQNPLGGIWGSLDGWTSINNRGSIHIGAMTLGFGNSDSADFLITACPSDAIYYDGFE